MARPHTEIAIIGGGIAGLWTLNVLLKAGYNAILLEQSALGSGQTIAAQGIIHSGLKYALSGRFSPIAREISAMPEIWRACLRGDGPVDLRTVRTTSGSQLLLFKRTVAGRAMALFSERAMAGKAIKLDRGHWPSSLQQAGFNGSTLDMRESVLDIPSLLTALSKNAQGRIFQGDENSITADIALYTAAGSNEAIASNKNHQQSLRIQRRPLLMGMLKNAPFDLWAHLIGYSSKPRATITTHFTLAGERVWYIGGGVAERPKDSCPHVFLHDLRNVIQEYLPACDIGGLDWACLPIDRIEGQETGSNHPPDLPTLFRRDNAFYAWPTKLTFAPLLAETIRSQLAPPQGSASLAPQMDFMNKPGVPIALPPWETAAWKNVS